MRNNVHVFLLLYGVVLRVGYFLCGDMMSLRETFCAENILSRSYREILYHLQILPDQPLNALGFYLMEKMLAEALGTGVYALRVYPLLCSLLALLIFFYLARAYLSSIGATMALAFFVLSEWLIVSAGLVGPYAADVLTGLLAVFAYEQTKRREFRPRSMLTLTVVGALSMWFSYAGLLVWLAVLLCLTENIITLRYVRRIPALMGLIGVWMVSFMSLYLVCLSHLIQSPYTWSRWEVSFGDAPFWSWSNMDWTIGAFINLFEYPVDFAFPLVGVIFFLAGGAGLVKRNPGHAVILVLPVGLTYVLASLKLYPPFGNEAIFLLPFVYLLIAAGLDWVGARFARPGVWISLLIFACLLIQPVTHSTDAFAAALHGVRAERSRVPPRRGEIVMLGDSLFALNEWESFLRHAPVRNMGIIGDRINDVRLRVAALRARPPEKIFVLVGINDRPGADNVDDLMRQYRRLILELQRASPQSMIFVSTLLPVNQQLMRRHFGVEVRNEDVRRFNRALKRLTAERGIQFVDSYLIMAEGGELPRAWTTDGVHLSREGYRRWRPLLLGVAGL